jgi:hypothetical protein
MGFQGDVSGAGAGAETTCYTFSVTSPNTAKKPVGYAPHPDDLDEVRASSEAAERGEFLSEEETAEMMRDLLPRHGLRADPRCDYDRATGSDRIACRCPA